jgi:3-phenylpropionate/trans-cinnamate dioxygenase ferredoxin subunit
MAHHWFKIFDSEDALKNCILPNTLVVFEFKNEKICVTQNANGFFAVQEKCPHNGASLSRGFCNVKNEIVCPLHRYSYDLKTGKSTSGSAFALKTYPIEVRSDGVFIGIQAKWWEA